MLKIKLDFHLINLKHQIGDKTYEYKSKGGIVMVLCLIAGFIAKYFGYLSWNALAIIGASIGACLAWDIITVLIYALRVFKLQNKVLRDAVSPDSEVIVLETSEGNDLTYQNHIIAFNNVQLADAFLKDRDDKYAYKKIKVPYLTLCEVVLDVSDCQGICYFRSEDDCSLIGAHVLYSYLKKYKK